MILALVSFALLVSGVVINRLRLGKRARLMVAGVLLVAALLSILFAGARLVPLSVLTFLIGLGLAANIAVRDRARTRGFEDLGEEPPQRPAPATKGMERAEAMAILGLKGEPTRDEITAAHKRMIVRAHPDQGGSDYLAAKVNEARQVLLGD